MDGLTVESKIHFRVGRHGRRQLVRGEALEPSTPPVEPGSVPRLAKLMALAVRFEDKLQQGQVRDMAQLARYGHVSRARLSQIMNLRLLAPDIQEDLLRLPRTFKGRAPIKYHDVVPIIQTPDWKRQRQQWSALREKKAESGND